MRRHDAQIGAQVWKAILFLLKLDFQIDEEFLDALAEHEEGKEAIFTLYETMYSDAMRSRGDQ